MAIYDTTAEEGRFTPKLSKWLVYGSESHSRFETVKPIYQILATWDGIRFDDSLFTRRLRYREYELKDHLGNVRVTFSDLKLQPQPSIPPTDTFRLDLLSVNNYYPFGMREPERNWTKTGTSTYRYMFNGKEQDRDIKGEGNSYDYGARFYDPRLGRWLRRDPFEIKYTSFSPYHFGFNNPIITIDPNGEENIVVMGLDKGNKGNEYNFVQTGLLMVNEYIKKQPDEKTTILLFNDGKNIEKIKNIQTKITQMYDGNVNVVLFSSDDNLTNYLNSQNTTNKSISSERMTDKVTDVSIFGHGLKSKYEPNYSGKSDPNSSWGIDDAKQLDPQSFETPTFIFFTCNAATPDNTSLNLAEETSKQVNGKVIGWLGKTTYENINNIEKG